MTKKNILAIAAIVLLAAGCGKAASNQPTNTTNKPAAPPAQTSLKDLFAAGKTEVCKIDYDQGNGAMSQGIISLANGKMRGDFTAQVNNVTVQSHVLTMDGTTYTWTDNSNMGFKMAQMQMNATSSASSTAHGIDMNQNVNYSCDPWTEDDSKFVLPSNITFTDAMTMQNEMKAAAPEGMGHTGTPPTTNNSAAMCAACNSAPASSQAQCKAALHCQ